MTSQEMALDIEGCVMPGFQGDRERDWDKHPLGRERREIALWFILKFKNFFSPWKTFSLKK